MEQPPNLDHFFRERLHAAEAPPPAFVWPRVEQELRRRRRRFLLWLWLGLGLGLAGAGLWSLGPVGSSAVLSFTGVPKVEPVHPSDLAPTENMAVAASASPDFPSAAPLSNQQTPNEISTSHTVLSPKRYPVEEHAPFGPAQPNAPATSPPILPMLPFEIDDLAPVVAGSSFPASSAPLLAALPGLQGGLRLAYSAPGVVLPKAKPFLFKKKPRKKCYDFAQHPRVWLVDAYAGPSLPQRQLTASQSGFEDYLRQRHDTERMGWAFHAGLRGSLVFGQHFLLRTGLHYEQMTEVFDYADPDFVKVTIVQFTKFVDNLPVTVIDTVVEYGEHHVKTYNRFGLLEIPLLAGAEFRAGRAGLSLQAGAALNVLFWKRGTILNTQGEPASFVPGPAQASPVFRRRAGWSATASAQLFYHLRSKVRVFAEPYYSRSFRPLTLASQPIAQRYTTWGLKLGVTRIFD